MASTHGEAMRRISWPELLTAVVLIAVLISIAIPVYDVGRLHGHGVHVKALRHAKQVHLALAEFAIDEDGVFPTAEDNANSAYRQLFDRRFRDERIFYVSGCAWHDSLPEGQKKPDQKVGTAPDYAEGLQRGENHWAYVSGLNNGSPGNLPVIADGFSTKPGVYTDDPEKRGGVWEGDHAVVVRVDGSARLEDLSREHRVLEKTASGGKVDIFSAEYFGGTRAKILNPW